MPSAEPPPFGRMLRQAFERTRERRKFDAVCREAIRGKSRDKAREIMVEQYRKAGQEPPGQPLLDRRVDQLLAPRTPVNGVSDLVEAASVLVGAATRLKKLLQDASDDNGVVRHHSDLYLKGDWHHTSQVELVDGAQSWIGDLPITGLISYRDLSMIDVNVQASASKNEGGVVMVKVGERLVGVLSESGADPFWEVLEVGVGDGFPVGSTVALRSQDPDGLWRLDLGAPEDVRRWLQVNHPHAGDGDDDWDFGEDS
jgi:hypothetical protein